MRFTWLTKVLIVLLFVGGASYWVKGVRLLFSEQGGVDVYLRWQEQSYIRHGQNPYDVAYAAHGVGVAPWDSTRDSTTDPKVGSPDSGGYPPWAFLLGSFMFWPPWPTVKLYFLAISLTLTAIAAVWAYSMARNQGRHTGWLAAASIVGISAYSTSTHVGQYGGVVVGLLALSAWCLVTGREVLGGVLMGMALLKPTIAGPFVLILLVTCRWRALAVCIGYVSIASSLIWWQTHTSPIEMLLQSLAAGSEYIHDSQGLIRSLLKIGLTPGEVTPALAALILVPGLSVMFFARKRSVLDLFAIAAVVGRLWAYHKSYDNMMVGFLFVALICAAITPRSMAMFALLVAGGTTWAPASLSKLDWYNFLQIGCWVVGLLLLLTLPRDQKIDRENTIKFKPLRQEIASTSCGGR